MELEDYFTKLRHADWSYEYSDDPRAYRNGRDAMAELERIARESPNHQLIFDAMRAWGR